MGVNHHQKSGGGNRPDYSSVLCLYESMPTPEVLLFIGLVLSLSQNLQNELRCTFQVQTYLSSGGASLYNECLPGGETAMLALQRTLFFAGNITWLTKSCLCLVPRPHTPMCGLGQRLSVTGRLSGT